MPNKVKVSDSKAAKIARKKFGLTVNLAKFINSIPALSNVWSAAKIPGVNSYQRLIKHNAKLTGENNLTLKNIITPPGTLPAPLSCLYKDDIINLEIEGSLYNYIPFIIHTIFIFYEPAKNKLQNFTFEYSQIEMNESKMNISSLVSLSLNSVQRDLFDIYNHWILYTAVTSSNEKTIWSSTSSFIIK